MAAKNGASSIEKEQIFGMAEKEMEYRVDLFNRGKGLFELPCLCPAFTDPITGFGASACCKTFQAHLSAFSEKCIAVASGFIWLVCVPTGVGPTLHYYGSLANCWWGSNSTDAAQPGSHRRVSINVSRKGTRNLSSTWVKTVALIDAFQNIGRWHIVVPLLDDNVSCFLADIAASCITEELRLLYTLQAQIHDAWRLVWS
ncbi:hypothetical protein MUK42_33076 [Musa troglodytarum]|uniref:Uncharacterized protein n=1 Tax=Musa troglodytarum TaxID=320322 RepID=A0A9E7L193_9LILI|nr:hypothetical protein MUK42_33076 [Musa troglodytarum]